MDAVAERESHIVSDVQHLRSEDFGRTKRDADGKEHTESCLIKEICFPAGCSFSAQKQAKQICLTESFADDFNAGVDNTLKNHVQGELIDLLEKYQSELRSFYLPDTSGKNV